MFTIEQIKSAHSKVKSGADFPRYIQDIKALGVASYETFVADSHTRYCDTRDGAITSDAKYPAMPIAAKSNALSLQQALKIHQSGGTDYFTFCRQAADAGVEKWCVDMQTMTCTYYDTLGNAMVVEAIPE